MWILCKIDSINGYQTKVAGVLFAGLICWWIVNGKIRLEPQPCLKPINRARKEPMGEIIWLAKRWLTINIYYASTRSKICKYIEILPGFIEEIWPTWFKHWSSRWGYFPYQFVGLILSVNGYDWITHIGKDYAIQSSQTPRLICWKCRAVFGVCIIKVFSFGSMKWWPIKTAYHR